MDEGTKKEVDRVIEGFDKIYEIENEYGIETVWMMNDSIKTVYNHMKTCKHCMKHIPKCKICREMISDSIIMLLEVQANLLKARP